MNPSRRLENKVAWISGAGSGIGQAAAVVLAEHGAAVAVIDLDAGHAEQVAKQITAAGGRAVAIACDVADESQVKDSITGTVRELGRLDIVVNNAGVVDLVLIHECSVERWDRLMAVNVRSIFLSTKHTHPHLKAAGRISGGGCIVNVGSISSFVGQAGTPAYTTSKHAVLGLTRSIALDYAADGIRCNCVCPGITDTPLLRYHMNKTGDAEGALRDRLKRVPMGVKLEPRDVAKAIFYFSCDDSAGITGTSLVVDCGYTTAAEWQTTGKTAFME
jgi:NAD(P)-dependent dehydrogenase (short-subunit alcohol dehydrogenase family)